MYLNTESAEVTERISVSVTSVLSVVEFKRESNT